MPVETPFITVPQLVTGHFHEGPGYGAWRTHGTNDWLLILTIDGAGRFGYRGGTGEMISRPGDLMLHTPGSFHDYGVERQLQRWELIWTHFHARPSWHELLNWPEITPGLMHIALPHAQGCAEIGGFFAELHRLANSGLRRREMFAANQLERLLLACDMYNPRSEQARLDPRIRRVIEHVCDHLGHPHQAKTLAKVAGLSLSRMAHLFRLEVGLSPAQFIETQRLNRAKELLLLTNRTIQTIAYDMGFENPFYFTLRFKKYTGISPREFRQKQGMGK